MTRDTTPDELRELLEKATPGEWIKGYSDQAEVEFNGSGHYCTIVSGERDCPVAFVLGMDRPYYNDPETDANIALILAMKASLPALLDAQAEAERLRGENEAAEFSVRWLIMQAHDKALDDKTAREIIASFPQNDAAACRVLNGQDRADRLEGALRDFVAVCDTAPPVELMAEIARVCEIARSALSESPTL